MSVDRSGMLVAVKRRALFGLRRDQQYISAFEIQEIYREAAAVRVDLYGEGAHRRFFWFWAEGASAAASIVKLLALKRSVELDAPGAAAPVTEQRGGLWAAVAAGIVTAGILSALLWRYSGHSTAPVTVQPKVTEPEKVTQPGKSPQPTQDRWVPSQPDAMDAWLELTHFDDEMSGLRLEFSQSFDALQKGSLLQQDFANRLTRSLIPRWEQLQRELAARPHAEGSATAAVHAALMKSAVEWQHALKIYVAGLRISDPDVVLIAFEHLTQAEKAQHEAEAAAQ